MVVGGWEGGDATRASASQEGTRAVAPERRLLTAAELLKTEEAEEYFSVYI